MLSKWLLWVVFSFISLSISGQVLWSPAAEADCSGCYVLDDSFLTEKLYTSKNSIVLHETIEISIPSPSGKVLSFLIHEISIMEFLLTQKYPQIKTFSGHLVGNKKVRIRADVTQKGFHAFVSGEGYGFMVDPYLENGVYKVREEFEGDQTFICQSECSSLKAQNKSVNNYSIGEALKTYQLAIATTGEYTSYHGGTTADAMAAVVTTINRVNEIFERDASVRFILVNNTDLLFQTDAATDPYSNFSISSMLSENQVETDNVIGSANYDVGHVFGTNGGGLAEVGGVCNPTKKAMGATGIENPQGDIFDVSYVCHELGHQINGVHTFNSCEAISLGSGPFGFEPGSGTSIMAYAGLCGNDNVQFNTDFYFHGSSAERIATYDRGCAEESPTLNTAPLVQVLSPGNKTIPRLTPFKLEGVASDLENNSTLTYSWEQMDAGPTSPLGSPSGSAPMFRIFPPVDNGIRHFPQLASILNPVNDPSERLPSYSRDLNFRLVVRDNNMGGGGIGFANYTVESTDAAGPFFISYPNNVPTPFEAFETIVVTWDVAGTDMPPVNCNSVNVLLSSNGGQDFDHILAANVPNSGTAIVDIPDVITSDARIKVEANDNIFFDINNNSFDIVPTTLDPGFRMYSNDNNQQVCDGEDIVFNVELRSIAGFSDIVNLTIEDLPGSATADLSAISITPTSSLEITISNITGLPIDNYAFSLVANSGGIEEMIELNFSIGGNFPVSPELDYAGNLSNLTQNPLLAWVPDGNTIEYQIEISDDPNFLSIIEEDYLMGNSYTPSVVGNSTTFFWRVRGFNVCGAGPYSASSAFHKAPYDCTTVTSVDVPIDISNGLPSTRYSKAEVGPSFAIGDVNVRDISIAHDDLSDLEIYLRHPDGTEVRLVDDLCIASQLSLSFDDASTNNHASIPCPPNTGLNYQPLEDLNSLNGKLSNGQWRLYVRDGSSGEGGQLLNWTLEVCESGSNTPAPFVVVNDTQTVPEAQLSEIQSTKLTYGSLDNAPSDIIYIIHALPSEGNIVIDGHVAARGSYWSQSQLDNGLVEYLHTGNAPSSDLVEFVVTNKDGGVLSDQVFSLAVLVNPLFGNTFINEEPECFGDSSGVIKISGQGGTPPYEYKLNTTNFQSASTFSGLPAGSYEPTFRDDLGFIKVLPSVMIEQPDEIEASLDIQDDQLMVTASGGTGSLEYSVNGIDYQSSPSFINLPIDEYFLYIKDGNGCVVTFPFEIISTSIYDFGAQVIEVFPNPSTGTIHLVGLDLICDRISVISNLGVEISLAIHKVDDPIQLDHLSKGVYFLKFWNGNNVVGYSKLALLP